MERPYVLGHIKTCEHSRNIIGSPFADVGNHFHFLSMVSDGIFNYKYYPVTAIKQANTFCVIVRKKVMFNVSSTKIVLPLLLAKRVICIYEMFHLYFLLSSKFNLDFGPSVSNN